MLILAIDVGSSSVKMGLIRGGKLLGKPRRQEFPTKREAGRAEVDPEAIFSAIVKIARSFDLGRRKIDLIAIDAMAPSWLVMDRRGEPITPIITHQDRRSVQIAQQLEREIGKSRCLKLSGNRPVPGGISSTTCAWFLRNEKSLMRRADLVGHFTTFLHRRLCGTRVIDPSNASFMGIFSTTTLGGWNDELCDAIRVSKKLLPEIHDANEVGGKLLPEPARALGLAPGTPMLVGMIDTGAAMLLSGAKVGQLVNVVGSTDVLALCTNKPRPREQLLLRALGVGRRWVSVFTIAAAGSSLNWAHQTLFSELSEREFFKRVDALLSVADPSTKFDPYLAGDRASVKQKYAAFTGLSLATTRDQMLAAMIDALAKLSAARIEILRQTQTRMHKNVLVSGGGNGALAKLMHRDWPAKWKFHVEEEATLRGLGKLASGEFGPE